MSHIVPVEFNWSANCIDGDEFAAIVAAFLKDDTQEWQRLCKAAEIIHIADVRGRHCPVPVREMRALLTAVSFGERIVLITDDPVAPLDIRHAAMQDGHYMRHSILVSPAEAFLIERA